MTDASGGDVTALLISWADGDRQALDSLIPIVYDELRAYGYANGATTIQTFSWSAYYLPLFRFIPEDVRQAISQSEVLDIAKYALGVGRHDWR